MAGILQLSTLVLKQNHYIAVKIIMTYTLIFVDSKAYFNNLWHIKDKNVNNQFEINYLS